MTLKYVTLLIRQIRLCRNKIENCMLNSYNRLILFLLLLKEDGKILRNIFRISVLLKGVYMLHCIQVLSK